MVTCVALNPFSRPTLFSLIHTLTLLQLLTLRPSTSLIAPNCQLLSLIFLKDLPCFHTCLQHKAPLELKKSVALGLTLSIL